MCVCVWWHKDVQTKNTSKNNKHILVMYNSKRTNCVIRDSIKRCFGDLQELQVYHKVTVTLLRRSYTVRKVLTWLIQFPALHWFYSKLGTDLKNKLTHILFNSLLWNAGVWTLLESTLFFLYISHTSCQHQSRTYLTTIVQCWQTYQCNIIMGTMNHKLS